jgi:hypothetical protein
MQFVTPEMAERILKMVEAGAANVNTEFASLLNELINYMIFVEIVSLTKYLLGLVLAGFIFRSFAMFILAAETEAKKNLYRGWRNIIVTLLTLGTMYSSYSSVLNVGKVLFAPKIYLVEKAIEKVKEIKGATVK